MKKTSECPELSMTAWMAGEDVDKTWRSSNPSNDGRADRGRRAVDGRTRGDLLVNVRNQLMATSIEKGGLRDLCPSTAGGHVALDKPHCSSGPDRTKKVARSAQGAPVTLKRLMGRRCGWARPRGDGRGPFPVPA